MGNDGKIYIVRWSLALSPVDSTGTQTAMLERIPDENQKEIMDSTRNMWFRMPPESYDGMTVQEFDELYLGIWILMGS